MPFRTELWKGTTYSLNFARRDFVNLVRLTDLMKLHLRTPNSLACECSRKECKKSRPVFPYFMFFFRWKRCQSAYFTFERAPFMLFPPHLPSLHFWVLPLFHHIVFSFFPQLTRSWLLLFTYISYCVNVCTNCTREISAPCFLITAFTCCTGQRALCH